MPTLEALNNLSAAIRGRTLNGRINSYAALGKVTYAFGFTDGSHLDIEINADELEVELSVYPAPAEPVRMDLLSV
jgi:hypothetical protein